MLTLSELHSKLGLIMTVILAEMQLLQPCCQEDMALESLKKYVLTDIWQSWTSRKAILESYE